MLTSVFVLPLAQGDVGRVAYTIESIRANCTDYIIAIVLDGIDSTDGLPTGDDLEYHTARYHSKGHWGAIWLNQMAVIKFYSISARTNQNTIYIKIDSDALVLKSGLYERAFAIFSSRPNVGQIGQVYTDCVGNRLKNQGWVNFYEKTFGIRGLRMFLFGKCCPGFPKIGLKSRVVAWLRYREYIKGNSEVHSYAIGGCYILRSSCVEAVIELGVIDEKTFLLTPDFGEDALMGLIIGACQFDKMDDVSDGGLFAVGGLYNKYDDVFRANPLDIAKRGHYIIHPFKFGYKNEDIAINEHDLVVQLIEQAENIK